MSWCQSGRRVVNFCTCWGFQYLWDSSQDMAQNIVHSPGGRARLPCLRFMPKRFSLALVFLFLHFFFFHFSQVETYSLAEVFPQTRDRWRTWGTNSISVWVPKPILHSTDWLLGPDLWPGCPVDKTGVHVSVQLFSRGVPQSHPPRHISWYLQAASSRMDCRAELPSTVFPFLVSLPGWRTHDNLPWFSCTVSTHIFLLHSLPLVLQILRCESKNKDVWGFNHHYSFI